jgi:hypothetical protein
MTRMNLLTSTLLARTLLALLSMSPQQNPTNGSIAGAIQLPGGAAVAGVRVTAMAVTDSPAAPTESTVFASTALADLNGHYRLENLPPGRYYIVAWPMNGPMYYPGGNSLALASIVTLTPGRQLAAFDIGGGGAFGGGAALAPPGGLVVNANPAINRPATTGRVVAEAGTTLPAGQVTVTGRTGNSFSTTTVVGNTFSLRLSEGDNQITLAGLPAGTSLKSIRYGNTDVGLGPVKITGVSQGELILTVGTGAPDAVATGRVSGKVVNMAQEWNPTNRMAQLSAAATGGPTLETPIDPNGSFVFPSVPHGIYRASIAGATGTGAQVTVSGNVSGLGIDLLNNPFPEFPGGAYNPIFDPNKPVTLRGVVTQAVATIRQPAPIHYFRMNARDASGSVTPYAVMITSRATAAALTAQLKLSVGAQVTVSGAGSRDGTNRVSLDGVARPAVSVNGLPVPNLLSP